MKDYLNEIEKYKSEISSFKTNEEAMEKKFNTLKVIDIYIYN